MRLVHFGAARLRYAILQIDELAVSSPHMHFQVALVSKRCDDYYNNKMTILIPTQDSGTTKADICDEKGTQR